LSAAATGGPAGPAARPEAGTGPATGPEAAAAGTSLGWEDDDFGSAFGDSDDEAAFASSRSAKGHGERKAEADDEGDFGVVLRSGAESVLFEDPRLAAFCAAQPPQQAPPQQPQRAVATSAASGLMESILVFDDEDEGY
jgi:hypothetical protein